MWIHTFRCIVYHVNSYINCCELTPFQLRLPHPQSSTASLTITDVVLTWRNSASARSNNWNTLVTLAVHVKTSSWIVCVCSVGWSLPILPLPLREMNTIIEASHEKNLKDGVFPGNDITKPSNSFIKMYVEVLLCNQVFNHFGSISDAGGKFKGTGSTFQYQKQMRHLCHNQKIMIDTLHLINHRAASQFFQGRSTPVRKTCIPFTSNGWPWRKSWNTTFRLV